jgi:hypothetical protein
MAFPLDGLQEDETADGQPPFVPLYLRGFSLDLSACSFIRPLQTVYQIRRVAVGTTNEHNRSC